MSFGFSPSDIVEFGKFIAKVVDALQEKGGSQFEYRSIIRQCQDVLNLMKDLERMDFSRVPQSLRARLSERMDGVKSVVSDFKALIAHYEKSMGEATKRGKVMSAPRKVQWALEAADDLSKFQPRLAAQLQMVEIILQMSVWNFLSGTSQSDRLLAAPRPTQLLLDNQPGSRQLPQLWNRGILDQDQMQGLATQITDAIYRRLTTPTSIAMPVPGRAFTVPDSGNPEDFVQDNAGRLLVEHQAIQAETATAVSPLVSLRWGNNALTHNQRGESASQAPHEHETPLVGEINEHLLELNLEELSNAEIHGLDDLALPRLLLEAPATMSEHEPSWQDEQRASRLDTEDPRSRSRRRFRPKFSVPSFDPLSGLAGAEAAIGLVSFASQMATRSSSIYRTVRGAPYEVHMFSRRVDQYSQLLSVVAKTLVDMADDKGLHPLRDRLMSDTEMALREAAEVMDRYANRNQTSRLTSFRMKFTWVDDRKAVVQIMNEIEALKLSLSIFLQTLEIRMQRDANGRIIAEGSARQADLAQAFDVLGNTLTRQQRGT